MSLTGMSTFTLQQAGELMATRLKGGFLDGAPKKRNAYILIRFLRQLMGNTLLYTVLHDAKDCPSFYREWDRKGKNGAGSLTFTANDADTLVAEMERSAVLFKEPYILDAGVPEAYKDKTHLSPKPMSDEDVARVKEALGAQG